MISNTLVSIVKIPETFKSDKILYWCQFSYLVLKFIILINGFAII